MRVSFRAKEFRIVSGVACVNAGLHATRLDIIAVLSGPLTRA